MKQNIEKVLFCWSGGKDSALALWELQKSGRYEVASLLTTVTEDYNRISMHGVRESLLEAQAQSLGIPLEKIYLTGNSSNEEYESRMKDALTRFKKIGVSTVAFGDIFLEDLKKYRENNLAKIGMRAFFPIWKQESSKLVHSFIDNGFSAVTTCIDSHVLDKSFVGRVYDWQYVSELPREVDPCGENGEFHSFVTDGPIFQEPIAYKLGEVVLRDKRYYFCDLLPA